MRLHPAILLNLLFTLAYSSNYYFDPSDGLARQFDGAGAISGGGATSKLLTNYPEPQRSDILDFLFKPNFGASFQIFKVEIGGDVQSSEGTESSHMHEEWDENFQRGYEWWLMAEAKKRNPKIKLCGLAWGYPSWLSDGHWNPYVYPNKTAHYISRWIWGAKQFYGLDIDCIGIWNEKPYSLQYIKILRKLLDTLGMSSVKIVAGDNLPGGAWTIVDDMLKDEEIMKDIDIIGVHYMGSELNEQALKTGKPIWSTEDWSSDHLVEGGGCMAQLLNRNYVYGQYTSLIAWNMLCGFYPRMSYDGKGMLLANEPWSGHYEVGIPIWTMAHTTQFTEIGWKYLPHGKGVGTLAYGGTYVSLVSPDSKHFTIIIETMDTSKNKFCNLPPAIPQRVLLQDANLIFKGYLSNISSLHIWRTALNFNGSNEIFRYMGNVQVRESRIESFQLEVNSLYTLTTVGSGWKGKSSTSIPESERFPKQFVDDYEDYPEYQESYGFTQQIGAFEVRSSGDKKHNKVMRQVVLHPPVHWCPFSQKTPMGVIGDAEWSDVFVSVDVYIPSVNSTNGVFVAARVDHGGCTTFLTNGIFFYLSLAQQTAFITTDIIQGRIIASKPVTVSTDRWYNLSLDIKDGIIVARLNNDMLVLKGSVKYQNPPLKGYVSLGCQSFGLADFDNLRIKSY